MWQQKWPACPPVADDIKHFYEDKWLRMHSLPGGKRYPENDKEYSSLILRHQTILNEIKISNTMTVILANWTNEHDGANVRWPEGYDMPKNLQYWQTIDESLEEDDEEFKSYCHLFVYQFEWQSGSLDRLFRYVAEDRLAGVIIAPEDLSWLYHPYDGGADVFFSTIAKKDKLLNKYKNWASN